MGGQEEWKSRGAEVSSHSRPCRAHALLWATPTVNSQHDLDELLRAGGEETKQRAGTTIQANEDGSLNRVEVVVLVKVHTYITCERWNLGELLMSRTSTKDKDKATVTTVFCSSKELRDVIIWEEESYGHVRVQKKAKWRPEVHQMAQC